MTPSLTRTTSNAAMCPSESRLTILTYGFISSFLLSAGVPTSGDGVTIHRPAAFVKGFTALSVGIFSEVPRPSLNQAALAPRPTLMEQGLQVVRLGRIAAAFAGREQRQLFQDFARGWQRAEF